MSGGGKSRKSGGVSKRLINALKSGKYDTPKKKGGSVIVPKDENKSRGKSIFEDK